MIYIHSTSSVSYQDSFQKDLNLNALNKITAESELITPNYKEFIPASNLRRLSPVLRMGLTAALDCKVQTEKAFDSIIVGTGLGCLKDTEKFLKNVITSNGGMISPTPFIQSTHNTIAGQISLFLKNNAYNITHTQNDVSFEVSLLDGMMRAMEGCTNVLVGAADETIPFLEELKGSLIQTDSILTSSATFMTLSSEKNQSGVAVKAVELSSNEDPKSSMEVFLQRHLGENTPDQVFHFGMDTVSSAFNHAVDLSAYTGYNQSRSGFAIHLAHDYLAQQAGSVLVVNQSATQIALTLLIRD